MTRNTGAPGETGTSPAAPEQARAGGESGPIPEPESQQAASPHQPARPPEEPPRRWRDAVDQLNELLRRELSAVETYDLALRSVRDAELSSALRNIRDNHDRRVTLLRDRVRALGGEPSHGSGAWGAFAKVVQRGADLFGDRAALAALEEGEDRGKKMYAEGLDDLDPPTRELVLTSLAPEQQKTHDLCSSLSRMLKAA